MSDTPPSDRSVSLDLLLPSLDAIDSAFVIYGGESGLIFANKKARKHWPLLFSGIESGLSREEAIGRQIDAIYPDLPDDVTSGMRSAILKAMERAETIDITTADGRIAQTVHYDVGDGVVFGVSADVTHRYRRDKELKEARKAAEAQSMAKTMFLAKMSHEIRTPMNGVLGVLALLASTELDDRQRSYVETIQRSATALLGIVTDILDLSKIELGSSELKPVVFDPADLVQDAVALMTPIAQSKSLQLAIFGCEGSTVIGDEGKIRQVLLNLIGNAIKFTDAGEVRVHLATEPSNGDVSLRLAVEDTGIGIEPSELDRVFEEFHQAPGEAASVGHGLGLPISKALIDAMGGTITASSEPGKGARFEVELTLPVADEDRGRCDAA